MACLLHRHVRWHDWKHWKQSALHPEQQETLAAPLVGADHAACTDLPSQKEARVQGSTGPLACLHDYSPSCDAELLPLLCKAALR